MNDYKELIDGLKMLEFFNQRAGRELWAKKPEDVQNTDISNAEQILTNAVDAIEQLVRERDAAVADLNKARSCITCKSDSLDFCEGCDSWRSKCNWEWRGVQE